MKVDPGLRNQILDVVNKQLKSNDPKETKITLNRLMEEGYSELDAKKLIGQCVVFEMYSVIKEQKPFNQQRFIKNLNQLPNEPIE